MDITDTSSAELTQLWNNRPDSIEELQSLYVDLIDKVDEEDVSDAFFVLRKAIEQFVPEENHLGLNGFRSYYYFRLKHHLRDLRRNERAKSDYMGAQSHFKQKLAFEREDNKHFAETGEHLREDDYFSDNKNYNVQGYMSRFDAALGSDGEGATLGDVVGEEDHTFEQKQLLEQFDEQEQSLISHIVAGTPIVELAKEYYGNGNYNYQSKVRGRIFELYSKVFNYYEGDVRFKTFFENVRSKIYDGDGIKISSGATIAASDSKALVQSTFEANRIPCRVCGTKFKPTHPAHKDCSHSCAVSKGVIPKSVTRDDFVEKLRDKTWGEVAFEYDRTTERIREWAFYFGIKTRKEIGAENYQQRYPLHLDGLPSRDELLKALGTMAFSEMQEAWGVNSEKTIRKWCSWYGLLSQLKNRPNKILSKAYKKNLKRRTRKLGRSNGRIRKARIERGWDPEVPDDPTPGELLSVLTTMPWSEMADHFQLSERKLMDLAKKYDIKHLRPRMIFSAKGARESAKGLKDALVRGRKIPTKEELAADLAAMTWDEMVDKWEWSDQWLKEKAKEYGIYDQKVKTIAAFDRITEKKYPMPSKEEFAEMLQTDRIYKLRRTLHRNESTIRRKAVEMGLRHLLESHHRPTKRDLREKLKKYTRKQILDFYMIRPAALDECLKEYDLDPVDYRISVAAHQKKLKAEEEAKKKRRLAMRVDGPSREETERILLSPGISSTKAAKLMGLDLKTAMRHVERLDLEDLWPTRRANKPMSPVVYGSKKIRATKQNVSRKKVCPPVDELRDALKSGGIEEAMKRFDLGYSAAYRFSRECCLTKTGEPHGELLMKKVSKEEIEALMPGSSHKKLAKHFGVSSGNVRTRIRHLGIDTSLFKVPNPPFDVDFFLSMFETHTWEEIAAVVGVTYNQAIYWADRLGIRDQKKMIVRNDICSDNATRRHRKHYEEVKASVDADQLRIDVETLAFDKVASKYTLGKTALLRMLDEFGIERPQDRIRKTKLVKKASLLSSETISPVYKWQMSTTFSPVRLVPVWSIETPKRESILRLPDQSSVAVCA